MADDFKAVDLTKVYDDTISTRPFDLTDDSEHQSPKYISGEELSNMTRIDSSWKNPQFRIPSALDANNIRGADLTKPEESVATLVRAATDKVENLPDNTKNVIAQTVLEVMDKPQERRIEMIRNLREQYPELDATDFIKQISPLIERPYSQQALESLPYNSQIIDALDGREYPVAKWAQDTIASATKAVKDREIAAMLNKEQRGIDQNAWSNKFAEIIGSMLPIISVGAGAGSVARALGASGATAGAVATGATQAATFVDMSGQYAYDTAREYLDKTGDSEFRNFTAKDAKGLSALGYGAIGTMIEFGFGGVEPLIGQAFTKAGIEQGIMKAVGKVAAGEAWEEFLQEWEEFLFRKIDGTNNRTYGQALKDSLQAALWGGLTGGALGGVVYRTNRRNIANILTQTGLDYKDALKVADTALSDLQNNIQENAETALSIKNKTGEPYNRLRVAVDDALKVVEDQGRRVVREEEREEFIDGIVDNWGTFALNQANMLNMTIDDFLSDIQPRFENGEIRMYQQGYMSPQYTYERLQDIEKRIADIEAGIASQAEQEKYNEYKKLAGQLKKINAVRVAQEKAKAKKAQQQAVKTIENTPKTAVAEVEVAETPVVPQGEVATMTVQTEQPTVATTAQPQVQPVAQAQKQRVQDAKKVEKGAYNISGFFNALPATEKAKYQAGETTDPALQERFDNALLSWIINDPQLYNQLVVEGDPRGERVIAGLRPIAQQFVEFNLTAPTEYRIDDSFRIALGNYITLYTNPNISEFYRSNDMIGQGGFNSNALLYAMRETNTPSGISDFLQAYIDGVVRNQQDTEYGKQARSEILAETIDKSFPSKKGTDQYNSLFTQLQRGAVEPLAPLEESEIRQFRIDKISEGKKEGLRQFFKDVDVILKDSKKVSLDDIDAEQKRIEQVVDKAREKLHKTGDDSDFPNKTQKIYAIVDKTMETYHFMKIDEFGRLRNINIYGNNNLYNNMGEGFEQDVDNLKNLVKQFPATEFYEIPVDKFEKISSDILARDYPNMVFDLADENARLDDIYPAYDGETIVVDGVERTVYNSEGKRINKSAEALTNFWRWFGDSKIVDEQGRPIIVYHGSLWNFKEFKGGEYNFSFSWNFARNYAETKSFEQGLDREAQVYEVYLKSEKPFDFRNPKDIDDLIKAIGNKKVDLLGTPKTTEDIIEDITGKYLSNGISQEEFDRVKENSTYDKYNYKVDSGLAGNDPIVYKTDDYFVYVDYVGSIRREIYDSFPIYTDKKKIIDTLKNNPELNLFDGDTKDIQVETDVTDYNVRDKEGNPEVRQVKIDVTLKKIHSPKTATIKYDADNWFFIENTRIDGVDFVDFLTNLGYDSYYKQEDGVLNIAIRPQTNYQQIKSVDNIGTYSEDTGNILYQSAYAGSRVDYDKPSLEAIGSGEGSAVHGWGLYYALEKSVAQQYYKMFDKQSPAHYEINGTSAYIALQNSIDEEFFHDTTLDAISKASKKAKNVDEFKDLLKQNLTKILKKESGPEAEKIKKAITVVDNLNNENISFVRPQVHEVDIPEMVDLLDEQKTYAEQSEYVKKALRNMLYSVRFQEYYQEGQTAEDFVNQEITDWEQGFNGGQIYDRISNLLDSDKEASLLMNEYGVKGITYFGNQDGRCFVIFNPDDVKVLRKKFDKYGNQLFQGRSPAQWRGMFNLIRGAIAISGKVNPSTIQHELAHFWLDNMWNRYKSGKYTDAWLSNFQSIAKWLGINPDADYISTPAHEQFARGYEAFISGRTIADVAGLKPAFDRYDRFVRRVYKTARDIRYRDATGHPTNPVFTKEAFDAFDRLLQVPDGVEVATNAELIPQTKEEKDENAKTIKKSIQETRTKIAEAQDQRAKENPSDVPILRTTGYAKDTDGKVKKSKNGYYIVSTQEGQEKKALDLIKSNPQLAESIIWGGANQTDIDRGVLARAYANFIKDTDPAKAELIREYEITTISRSAAKTLSHIPRNDLYRSAARQILAQKTRNLAQANYGLRAGMVEQLEKDLENRIALAWEAVKNAPMAQKQAVAVQQIREIASDFSTVDELPETLADADFTQVNERTFTEIAGAQIRRMLGLTLTQNESDQLDVLVEQIENTMQGESWERQHYLTEETARLLRQYSEFIAGYSPQTIWDKATKLYYPASMLMNLPTHFKNVITNTIQQAVSSLSVVGGMAQIEIPLEQLTKDAKYDFNLYLKTGFMPSVMTDITSPQQILGEKRMVLANPNWFDSIAEKSLNVLSVEDAAFKSISFYRELAIIASKQAKKEGLTGKALKARALELYREGRALRGQTEWGIETRAQASEIAKVDTFVGTNGWTRLAKSARNTLNQITIRGRSANIGNILSPFIVVGTNIVRGGFNLTGLPIASGIAIDIFHPQTRINDTKVSELIDLDILSERQAKALFKGGKINQRVARTLIAEGQITEEELKGLTYTERFGGATVRGLSETGFAWLFIIGLISALDDDDWMPDYDEATATEKARAKEQGIQFGSIRIGNTWVSTDLFGYLKYPIHWAMNARRFGIKSLPQSALNTAAELPVISDVMDLWNQNKYNKTTSDYLRTFGNTIIDKLNGFIPGVVNNAKRILQKSGKLPTLKLKKKGEALETKQTREFDTEDVILYTLFGQAISTEE